ncbi:hypothetical protein AHAS_Ahas09G0192600 [Arachis hypogaea]
MGRRVAAHHLKEYTYGMRNKMRTGGFLTNNYSPKKFCSPNKKLVFGPTQPPDCIFILDTDPKSSVINEAHNLHIPVVAIVDSSMPLHSFSRVACPVPANPSVQFVYLFCNLLTKTLLLEKEKGKLKKAAPLQIQAGKAVKIDLPNLDITVFPYATLPPLYQDMEETKKLLDKLVVLKLDVAKRYGFGRPQVRVFFCYSYNAHFI